MSDDYLIPRELLVTALALKSAEEKSKSYVLVFTRDPRDWNLEEHPSWITISTPMVSSDYAQWELSFATNSDSNRMASLNIVGPHCSVAVKVSQPGGAWIEQQASMILLDPLPPSQTERLKFPLAMEFGAAGKFIAEQLSKLPPPAKAAAYAAVRALIRGLEVAAIAIRSAFSAVPEPPNYFQPQTVLTQRMTTALIQQQTKLLITYISDELSTKG
jgi:hypothetical protein